MIQITVDPKAIQAATDKIASKVKQLELIVSPISLTEISKAVFTITTKKFLKDLTVEALMDTQRYHHIYEWNSIGKTNKKLFVMKRSKVQYGNLIITIIPLQSTTLVPLKTIVTTAGPTGKSVTARSIFRDKMDIMENDIPIHYITKRNIVFTPDGTSLVFVHKDTPISILHPGGNKTTHALRDFADSWYATKASVAVSSSQLLSRIGQKVAIVVSQTGSTPAQVYAAITSVAQSYGSEISQI